MTARQQQDARHREAVRAYYDSGRESLLGPVLAELRPRLVDFLRGKNLRDAQQVQDLAQEALTGVLTGLRAQQYAFAGSVASWALTICWHCFTSSRQRKANGITQPGRDEDPFLLLADSLAEPADLLPVQQEEENQAGAVVEAVTYAVLDLDPNARACVLLHYYQGLPEADAATRLGISPSTFRSRLRRGLAELQTWAISHRHLAPGPDLYTALVRVNSGDLFREPLCLAA